MFNPMEDENDFKPEDNLSKFVEKFFSTYLDEDSMTKVLEKCLFPKDPNLSDPKLDEDLVDILEDDKKNVPLLKSDKGMSRILNSLMRVMTPLFQLWTSIDKIKKGEIKNDTMSVDETINLIEKTVICLGQVNVQIIFFRRLPIIAKLLGNTKKAQKIIIRNASKLDGKKELLGTKFQKVLGETVKKRKHNKELKRALSSQRPAFRPFRGTPSTSHNVGGRGVIRFQNDRFQSDRARGTSFSRGRYSHPKNRGRYTPMHVDK